MRVRFAVQSYHSRSLPVSAQTCKNFYAKAQPPDAKSEVVVLGCPGIVDFATCGAGPVRGMHRLGGVPHVVSGTRLYSVSSTGTATDIGGNISGTGVVSMDDNGDELLIVNGTSGYIYSVAAGFRLITDADFNAASTVAYINGRFVLPEDGTNEFFISDSLDGTSYSDLFASAEWKSDNVVAVKNHLQTLYLLGELTIEPWIYTGAANFPFQRMEAAAIDRGIIGPHAAASEDQKLFILGNDRIAHQIDGQQIVPVSTDAINEEWQDYSTITDASVFSYTFDGHRFVVYNFPTMAKTWVRDITTTLWHERESWDQFGQSLGRWRGNCAIEAYNKVLIGDAFSGKVGYLSASTYTEFGNTIRGELISPPLHADGKRGFMPWFEAHIETGVGLSSGQGSDPQWMLGISDDGGRTWSDQELWRSAGALGQYRTRLLWDRLGMFEESRLLRLTTTDPVRRVLIAARCPELTAGV